ncbi:MAG TPA: hypothetical protein DIC34_14315 [Treponema sp.]|nr:MAG: hypothetical protein A2001_10205 [Treponema sp. GWC1_61_84]OHE73784.1 MAG: hypothetical protein A2413_16430 [Treponema sp. RIFOXYC1_FULL_61_9]HCM27695.1 hypothetical protein [Treponema sp.]
MQRMNPNPISARESVRESVRLLPCPLTSYTEPMEDRIASSANEIKQRVSSLIGDSEILFRKVADTYPSFVRELERSLRESASSLSSMGAGASMDEAMRNLFESTRATIGRSTRSLDSMEERDKTLLVSLSAGIDRLSGLDAVIARIKDDSMEMELISLNAMTVALKSGAAGKAFSVITDELKRLSARTIDLTDMLTENGRTLLDHFLKYRKEVEGLEATRVQLFEGLDETIHSRFVTLESVVREIGTSLARLVELSAGVGGPIRSIMEMVQIQDLVKQSLDHVVMAMDEIVSVSSDDPLDDCVFHSRLASISISIIADVRSRLEAALAALRRDSAAVRGIVSEGESRRRAVIESYFGKGREGSSDRSFQDASRILEEIGTQSGVYMRTKGSIANSGSRLSSSVAELEGGFKAFSKILNRFRTIDIASRIEVSKQSILRTMNDTVVEMSLLTDRIAEDVDEALLTTRSFIGETKSAVRDYAENSEKDAEFIERTAGDLKDAHGRLSALQESIKRGVLDFSLFTKDFIDLLETASGGEESFERLIGALDAVSVILAAMEATSEATLRGAGGDTGGGAGGDTLRADPHSARLKEVIERFTIYAHKRVAADLGGFQVEDSVAVGDVTFF